MSLGSDDNLSVAYYTRSQEQNQLLGVPNLVEVRIYYTYLCFLANQKEESATASEEVISFQTNCPQCHSPTETRMKTVGGLTGLVFRSIHVI